MHSPARRTIGPSTPRVLLFALMLALLVSATPTAREHGPALALHAPPLLQSTVAPQIELASIASEAGIAAWFQTPSPITLADVSDAFRTIEVQTSSYIIGSVPVTNYPETEDVHVYVHTDGWIMAYYLALDPVGKILDWRAYHDAGRTSITTKLENTIERIAVEAGMFFDGATYYDFRYPNATHLLLVVEWVYEGDDFFQVNLPSDFIYYQRSWSLGGNVGGFRYWLNGEGVGSVGCGTWPTSQGTLAASQLPPAQLHTIDLDLAWGCGDQYGYAALALVYRAPQ